MYLCGRMAFVELDDSRFPLVTARFLGTATDEEFEAYLKSLEQLWLRKQRYALILDASEHVSSTARQRGMQAKWLADHDATLRQLSVASAFVITSAVVRGIATAVFWLQPMPMPHTIVATRAEAESFCIEQLRKAGVPFQSTSAAKK